MKQNICSLYFARPRVASGAVGVGDVDEESRMVDAIGRQNDESGRDDGNGFVTREEYLTIKEAAQYLSISEPVLRLTVRCGKIPAKRGRGGQPLIKKKHLLPFLDPSLEGQVGS